MNLQRYDVTEKKGNKKRGGISSSLVDSLAVEEERNMPGMMWFELAKRNNTMWHKLLKRAVRRKRKTVGQQMHRGRRR